MKNKNKKITTFFVAIAVLLVFGLQGFQNEVYADYWDQWGGKDAYATSQQTRYTSAINSGDADLQQRLEADAKRVGYTLTSPTTYSSNTYSSSYTPTTAISSAYNSSYAVTPKAFSPETYASYISTPATYTSAPTSNIMSKVTGTSYTPTTYYTPTYYDSTGYTTQAYGNLYCISVTDSTALVYYSYKNASNASLFRGSTILATMGAGSKSGTFLATGLSAGTSYTFYLRNGNYSYSSYLASGSCTTSGTSNTYTYGYNYYTPTTYTPTTYTPVTYTSYLPETQQAQVTQSYEYKTQQGFSATGRLKCGQTTEDSISILYDVENGSNSSLFRNTTRIKSIGLGDKTGIFTETNLSPETSYTFYLRDGSFSYSELLDVITCKTEEEERGEEEIFLNTKIRNLEKNNDWTRSVTVSPNEIISFSIDVTAGRRDLRDVIVKNRTNGEIDYMGSVRVDGRSVSGNIENGINIGDVYANETKTITFDAQIFSENYFDIGTTRITSTTTASSSTTSTSDSNTISVLRNRVEGASFTPPTTAPTGVTDNIFFQYALIPFFLIMFLLFFFKKQISLLLKKVENGGKELRSEWY